jgi:hypothetical protein
VGEYSRVYFDENLGHHADEVLETVFYQINHRDLTDEDRRLLPSALDPYARTLNGIGAISFAGCLSSVEQAKLWAQQFGDLDYEWRIREQAFDAIVYHPDGNQKFVRHKDEATAIVLAGVQVLRECAYRALAKQVN